MRKHKLMNKVWNKEELGEIEEVLGTIDQLITDRYIMEEIKKYHRNLAVDFYEYKKVCDKVHHNWLLYMYEWIGIPKEVTELIHQLICKWKTKLEIWNEGEKVIKQMN